MKALPPLARVAVAVAAAEGVALVAAVALGAGGELDIAVHAAAWAGVGLPLLLRLVVQPAGERIATLTEQCDELLHAQDMLRQHVRERDDKVAAAQQRLTETIGQLDAALNNMGQGLCMYDAEDRLILCNDRYLRMYGLSAAAGKPGTPYRAVLAEQIAIDNFHQDPDVYIASIRKSLAAGEAFERLVSVKRKTVRVVVQPLANGGWVATHEDVTAQRRAEADLADTRNFLDTVIEHVPATILVKDARTLRYVLLNRASQTFFGRPREELIGKSAHDLYPPRTADEIELRDRQMLASASGESQSVVSAIETGRGLLHVASRRVVLRAPDGEPAYLLTVIDDITDRKKAEAQIVHLAHHDPLTGLPNRAAFAKKLAEALAAAYEAGEAVAVMCVDLDRFKEINDAHGHAAGDALLMEVARRLGEAAHGAFIARLGGDEFIILVTEGGQPETARAVADRVQRRLAEDFHIDGSIVRAGSSIGVAVYPADGRDAATLFANADAALYRSKEEGRGLTRFFAPEMGERLRQRRALQLDLQAAIANGQLALRYQPVARADGEVVGFEALPCWRHPERGVLEPATFMPLAEESSLIVVLGEWMLGQACREAASWPWPLTVAVRLSPMQFRYCDVPNLVHATLIETGLSPQRLELEVSGTTIADDVPRTLAVLRRLKTLGVRVALGAFGGGRSSLVYLRSFPFDAIRIDRTVVADAAHQPRAAAVVRAAIGLGRELAVPVTAEGVETGEQFAFLCAQACDRMQGRLIGEPRPIGDYVHSLDCGRQALPIASAG